MRRFGNRVLPVYTWLTRPAVGNYIGELICISDYDHAVAYWNASAWVLHEFQQLKHQSGDVTISSAVEGTVETVVGSILIRAGSFKIGETISPVLTAIRTARGAVFNQTIRFRLGILGTIVDTQLVAITNAPSINVPQIYGNLHGGLTYKSTVLLDFVQANVDYSTFAIPGTIPDPATTDLYLTATAQLANAVGDTLVTKQLQVLIY